MNGRSCPDDILEIGSVIFSLFSRELPYRSHSLEGNPNELLDFRAILCGFALISTISPEFHIRERPATRLFESGHQMIEYEPFTSRFPLSAQQPHSEHQITVPNHDLLRIFPRFCTLKRILAL
jgi:hypothetical protein